MDKYEFSLKMDQMKKLVNEEDYRTALKIVDSIDWNRVRNTNLLTMAASVYEQNGKLKEARRILEQALERSPVGKRILFKLAEVAVEMGDLKAAEDYYYEYRQVDPEDINIYLLQFLILRGRRAPYDRQLQPLELYCEQETDERWFYELAETYDNAGMYDDAIRMCDKIALMFGNSKYAEKALRIKLRHTNLTEEQMSILYPGTAAADNNRAGSKGNNYGTDRRVLQDDDRDTDLYSLYGLMQEPDPSESAVLRQEPVEEYEDIASRNQEAMRNSDALAALRYDDEDAEFDAFVKAMEVKERTPVPVAAAVPASAPAPAPLPKTGQKAEMALGEGIQMAFDFGGNQGMPRLVEEEPAADIEEPQEDKTAEIGVLPGAEAPQSVPKRAAGTIAMSAAAAEAADEVTLESLTEISKAAPAGAAVPAAVSYADTFAAIRPAVGSQTQAAKQADPAPAEPVQPVREPERPAVPARRFDMIVEAETVEEGLKVAVEELKRVHDEYNIRHASAKTTADKLNSIGLSEAVLKKLKGRDFVIEAAGDLDPELIEELYRFIRSDRSGTIVVMVDTPEGLDAIEDVCPELFDICDYVSDIEDEPEDDIDEYEDSFDDGFDDEDDFYEEHAAQHSETKAGKPEPPRKRSDGEVKETYSNVKLVEPSAPGEEMEIDDFAQYCNQYATEIDCSITGTSMLALYERIEILEEDGVKLTRENAEKLIEEAADRAEKPPLGKRITGMFHSKYDKNGCLILKESDFIY